MKKNKKLIATIAAATMAITSLSMTSLSASATTNVRIPYMLGDVNGDYVVDGTDATLVLRALDVHGLERGYAVSLSYVQTNLSDWFPNAPCAVAADVDKDGYISYDDADKILRHYTLVISGKDDETDMGKLFLYEG